MDKIEFDKRHSVADTLQEMWNTLDYSGLILTPYEKDMLDSIAKRLNKLCLELRGTKNNIEIEDKDQKRNFTSDTYEIHPIWNNPCPYAGNQIVNIKPYALQI